MRKKGGHSTAFLVLGQFHRLAVSSGVSSLGRTTSPRVGQMHHCKHRMTVDHAWAGVAHHHSHRLPHLRLVAVHPALGASSLAFLERAPVEALQRIVTQGSTFLANRCRAVDISTVQRDHGCDCLLLTVYAAVSDWHRTKTPRPEELTPPQPGVSL